MIIASGSKGSAIHRNIIQGAKTKALTCFKNDSIRVLIATDIDARGLDIPLSTCY